MGGQKEKIRIIKTYFMQAILLQHYTVTLINSE